MNKGWQRKRVREIATHSLGKMLDKAKNKGEPKPYLRNLNVRWFDFDLSDVLKMRFLPEESAKYTAIKGDVLVCEGGYPGRAAIWEQDEPIYFQKALHRVRFHEPERSKWFVYYLLFQDLDGTLKNYFNGAGIQHFTGEALAQFEVPVPPLPEQRRIVGILDEAFEGIATAKANAEKNLQNARALFENHLQSVLSQRGKGWVETVLGDVCGFVRGPFGGSLKKSIFVPDGYAVYEQQHAIYDQFDKVRYFVDEAKFREMKRFELLPDDLIMSCSGTMGRVAVVPKDIKRGIINQALLKLTPTGKMLNTFLKSWMESEAFQDALNEYSGGAAIQNVASVQTLKEIKVPLPPIAEQSRVVDELDDLREETQRLGSVYQRKLDALDALKKSLLHQAFTGEL
jgi:type I restriction enzyme, S subunit